MISMIYTTSCDSYHFFKKQIKNIIILSSLCSLVTIIIQYFIGPNINELSILYNTLFFKNYSLFQIMQNITPEQKKIIIHIFCSKNLSLLINHTLLYGSIIFLIQSIILKKQKNLYQVIIQSFSYMPILFPLIFFKFFIIEVGFIILMAPGVIFSALLPLSPIILLIEKKGIMSSLKNSIFLSWKNIYVIMMPLFIWNILKWMIINFFITLYVFPININIFLINIFLNIGYSYVIIYLFRFNTLIKLKNIL